MNDLIIFSRFLYFFSINAHHKVTNANGNFFSDHSYLGDLYSVYLELFDSLCERVIGLGGEVNEFLVTVEAVSMFNKYINVEFTDNTQYFVYLAGFEKQFRDLCAAANEGASLGVSNLVSQMSDDSEARSYKLNQRIK